MKSVDDLDSGDYDELTDAAEGRLVSLEARYERPESDGVGALHDVEAESGDESEAEDLFSVDRLAAIQAGVALDPIADEPVID